MATASYNQLGENRRAGLAAATGHITAASDGCALGKLPSFFLLISLKHVKATN